jgi:drug/metabolite transporter (DMT)-like permease
MTSILPIFSKVVAESLLSLYPVFVKKIGLSIPIQLWTRLLAYVIISAFFINRTFVFQSLTSYNAILLALINLSHVYFSYMGFKYLDSGVSFTLFNTYPFMILLMSNAPWNNSYLLALAGFAIFAYENYIHNDDKKEEVQHTESMGEEGWKWHNPFIFGVLMILLSAFTEALIYFLVRKIKSTNSWDHVFISYFLGALIMSIYMIYVYFYKKEELKEDFSKEDFSSKEDDKESFINNRIFIALLLNGILGAVGYYLRFYAAYRLDSQIYAILSYIGIIMAYVYGIFLNKEKLSIYKIVGTLFIIIANYMILQKK